MINCVHELVGAKAIVSGGDVHLQSEHVSGGKLLSRLQHAIDAVGAPGGISFGADRILVVVGSDAAVGGRQNSTGWIVDARHLVERNPSLPFMSVVAAADRQAAIAGGADGHAAGCLISNVPVDVAEHDVLPWRDKIRERFAKFVPVLGGVHVEENQSFAILK